MKKFLTLAFVICACLPSFSQPTSSGNGRYKETFLMKPPSGAKVAVYAFEDLECPSCGHAFPIVQAACLKNKVPLVNRDFTWPFHSWSLNAAVNARYLEDKVSPKLAADYRRDIFASQARIASKDDLSNFTRRWFQSHGQSVPFVIDPNDTLTREVNADRAFGTRIGVYHTPTFFVVSDKGCVNVDDPNLIDQTVQAALSQAATPVRSGSHK